MLKKPDCFTLKPLLIATLGVALLGIISLICFLFFINDFHVAWKLRKRGFDVQYEWINNLSPHIVVVGMGLNITPDDSQLLSRLSRLYELNFVDCNMSSLNLSEIENCQELYDFRCVDVKQFPLSEIRKLTACPIKCIELSHVDMKDSDVKMFAGFSKLESLGLDGNNSEITDASFEYFEKKLSLKTLVLLNTSITKEGACAFQKKRPDVKLRLE